MKELGFLILKISVSLDTNCKYLLFDIFTVFSDFSHHLNFIMRTFPLTFNLKCIGNVMETLNYKSSIKNARQKLDERLLFVLKRFTSKIK